MSGQNFKRVTLHLARTKEHPDGSTRHGYEFVAPLDASGHIDTKAWKEEPGRCIVHRFWGSERPLRGLLVRRAGGAEGGTWGFDYDRATHGDDEAGFRFGSHAFQPGEYVSIRDPDDDLHTFRVVSVVPA